MITINGADFVIVSVTWPGSAGWCRDCLLARVRQYHGQAGVRLSRSALRCDAALGGIADERTESSKLCWRGRCHRLCRSAPSAITIHYSQCQRDTGDLTKRTAVSRPESGGSRSRGGQALSSLPATRPCPPQQATNLKMLPNRSTVLDV